MCAVVGAVFGTIGAGLALPSERESGVLTRLWVQPVHRASPVAGRLVAEAARTVASAFVLTVFGVALGLRFNDGWIAMLAFVLVPVTISAGIAALGTPRLLFTSPGPRDKPDRSTWREVTRSRRTARLSEWT